MARDKDVGEQRGPGSDAATGSGASADRLPARRRGGQELPDNVQDRPEQNAGYDAAVHRGPRADDTHADAVLDVFDDAGGIVESPTGSAPRARAADIDDQAERDAIAEVRRRERRQP
jgi:hypothetical protein